MTFPLDEYMLVTDAAREIGITRDALARRCHVGTCASTVVLGRKLIHRDEVARLKANPVKRGPAKQ